MFSSISPQIVRRAALAFLLPLSLLMTACGAGPVHLEPAPDATNPECAKALVAMPEELGGLAQRETTAQATTAWGDPASIILKCGVEVPGPVSDPCASVNGVDWIIKPSEEKDGSTSSTQTATGTWTATTFGRSPDVQVTFDADKVSSSTLLVELGSPVAQLKQTEKCSNIDDSLSTQG